MAKRNFNVDIDLQSNQILNAVLDKTNALIAEGQVGFDNVTKRASVHDGTSAKVMAFLEDVTRLGRPKGVIDASLGLLPTNTDADAHGGNADLDDFWRVSVAGTITGLGALKVGDVIYANKDNPTVAADFDVIPFPIDFANAFENGISVDGTSGKAGLGGTLVRDSVIAANSFYWGAESSTDNQVVLTDENLYLKAATDILMKAAGGAINIEAFANLIIKSSLGLRIDIPSATTVGAPLVLVSATTKEVAFPAAAVALLDSATATVPANTPTAFTMANLTTVRGFNVFDSAGNEITSNVAVSKATNVVTVTSNALLTGVVVEAWGV